MCRKLPTSREQFLNVSGVGRSKADKYSDAFCEVISEYIKNNPDAEKAPDGEVNYLESQLASFREHAVGTTALPKPKPWTESEESQLAEEFNAGKCITEIARIHKRTNGAIRSRLKKMGILT